jgi:wyosine [tRNA(Phe)-imidazoG37] synthetase (radical SAM superfamily)
MRYIFGPVYSRRFGISLGIDLSPDKKRCNFDCLYCELDRSKPVNSYDNPPDPEEIFRELKGFLEKNPEPDVITITSNGEPTLYPYLDSLVTMVNSIKNSSKTLILSNGSTIYKKEIQKTLKKFDIVKISLDAVSQQIFKKIDRPHSSISLEKILKGLKRFREDFEGKLVIEILVVKYVNDKEEHIKEIGDVLKDIKPDRIDIGTVDRPPAYRVFPVSNEKLHHLASLLKDFNVNVVERRYEKTFEYDISREDIVKTLSKRPLTQEDIENTFSLETKKKLQQLLEEGKVKHKNGFFLITD